MRNWRREIAFREQLAQGATLDDLLVLGAAVREAGRRFVNMRHFDVQLIGGIVLHRGKIAEMKTGEGKTLVATLPVYLNALAGKGVIMSLRCWATISPSVPSGWAASARPQA